jgi:hypothetical protein
VVAAKTASSLVQAPAKRNMPTTLSTPLQPAREKPLFDRHGEAGDQPRNLIQMSRIKRLNGFRKTKQAFVITHGGNVAGDDRRSGVDRGGRDGWHRISSMKPGGPESF